MGYREKCVKKNRARKEAQWRERQVYVQSCKAKSPYNVFESEEIRRRALEDGFQ